MTNLALGEVGGYGKSTCGDITRSGDGKLAPALVSGFGIPTGVGLSVVFRVEGETYTSHMGMENFDVP